jgi:hypothetical protein
MDALATSGTQHHFPIFSSLLRHASSAALSSADAAAVVGVAAQQATKLGPAYAMPALAAALQELPRLAAGAAAAAGGDAEASAAGAAELQAAAMALVRQLAEAVGSPAELAEALALGLRRAGEDADAGNAAAAAAGVAAAAAAAEAWAGAAGAAAAGAGSGGGAEEAPREALPGGVLPQALVAAVLALDEAPGLPGPRWQLHQILARLLPAALQVPGGGGGERCRAHHAAGRAPGQPAGPRPFAPNPAPPASPPPTPQGLRTDKQAAALAGAVCRTLFSDDPDTWAAAAPANVAAADRLLRACLAGGGARPETQLALGRWLLHATREWAAGGGYAAAAGGADAQRAAAVVQAASAAARLLSAAPGGAAVLPALELELSGAAGLAARPGGLAASAPAFDAVSAPSCAAALARLDAAQPPAAWADSARAALLAAPALAEEFGSEGRLGELLDQAPAEEARYRGPSAGAKQP